MMMRSIKLLHLFLVACLLPRQSAATFQRILLPPRFLSRFASKLSMTAPPADRPRRIVVVGGGLGGLASAFDARHLMRPQDVVTVVSDRPQFSFTPSNPWVAVRTRKPEDIQLDLDKVLPRHNVDFVHGKAVELKPNSCQLKLEGGKIIDYDYLIVATGPRLAFETIPGLKEAGASVCTTPHAMHAADELDKLVADPGPIVVGATQGASCFGPAYEYAFLLKHALRKRGGQKLVDSCPMTFVTSEPYIGHLGLQGAGDSSPILENLMKKNNISTIVNAVVDKVSKHDVTLHYLLTDPEQLKDQNSFKVVGKKHVRVPSKLTMLIPPFHGQNVWKNVPGLSDQKGMIIVNEYQQSPQYPNIFGVGVTVSIPNKEITPVPIGIPKTGYFIESQGTAAVKNIRSMINYEISHQQDVVKGNPSIAMKVKATLNGLCLTDFGDDGAIFVTMPQMRPRRYDWTIEGKIATLAKIAFEKYFLHKIESGDTDPYYEKYMLKLIGIERTEARKPLHTLRLK